MNATLSAARIDGPGETFLSLHTTREGAVAALVMRGSELYRRRFGYVPPALTPVSPSFLVDSGNTGIALDRAADALRDEGWNARVEEVEVYIDEAGGDQS